MPSKNRKKIRTILYYYLPLDLVILYSFLTNGSYISVGAILAAVIISSINLSFFYALFYVFFFMIKSWIDVVVKKRYEDRYIDFDYDPYKDFIVRYGILKDLGQISETTKREYNELKNNIHFLVENPEYYRISKQVNDRVFYATFAVLIILLFLIDDGKIIWVDLFKLF